MPARRPLVEYKYLVAAAFVFGLFMDLLDGTIVNVALPTLAREFHAGNATLAWVVTGYLLSLAVWIPASGWMGDRFGTKKVFIFAIAMFILGSALCGRAWSIESLIGFRILQGVGGGMMTPVGTAMVFRVFKPDELKRASVAIAIPTVIAPAAGPILGGWLVDGPGWRWIFYINLPIGIAALLFSLRFLREHTEPQPGRFDVWGFALSGAGLALVLYALSQAPNAGWTAPNVLGAGLVGLALIVVLVRIELHMEEPLLHLRLFGDRMFRNANLAFFAGIASLIGVLFLLPLFLQQLRGLSALQSGLTTFPQAFGVVAMVPVAGWLYPHVGPRRMVAAGLVGTALTALLLLRVDLETSLWWIRGIMVLQGMALGLALIPLQTATFARIGPSDTGRASALFNTSRQVASSLGVAVLASALVSRTNYHIATEVASVHATGPLAFLPVLEAARHGALLGFHDAFAIAAATTVVGILFALLIRDEDAVNTMTAATGAPSSMFALHWALARTHVLWHRRPQVSAAARTTVAEISEAGR